jgi:hypothetical protein
LRQKTCAAADIQHPLTRLDRKLVDEELAGYELPRRADLIVVARLRRVVE